MKSFICCLLVSFPLLLSAQKTSLKQLQFSTTEKQALNHLQLPKGSALLLTYFRTDCDYCRHSAREIKEQASNYPAFIWMVSPEEADVLTTFEEMNGLYGLSNLVVASDHSKSMHNWFQFEAIPFYVLFDNSGKQVTTLTHFPSSEEVKKLLAK